MPKTNTCIILTGRAVEAAEFYADVFGVEISQRVPDGRGGTMLCVLTIDGHDVVILNGAGPEADIQSQRVTTQIVVDGQEEFDHYWDGLLAGGGTPSHNGWLVDRFGVWWDIVPVQQMQLVASASPETMPKVAEAAMTMQRIDIAELERIARGE